MKRAQVQAAIKLSCARITLASFARRVEAVSNECEVSSSTVGSIEVKEWTLNERLVMR